MEATLWKSGTIRCTRAQAAPPWPVWCAGNIIGQHYGLQQCSAETRRRPATRLKSHIEVVEDGRLLSASASVGSADLPAQTEAFLRSVFFFFFFYLKWLHPRDAGDVISSLSRWSFIHAPVPPHLHHDPMLKHQASKKRTAII